MPGSTKRNFVVNPIDELVWRIDQANLWEKEWTAARNEYIKVQGSADTRLHYVVSGSVRVFVMDALEEHTIRFGYAGNFVAALDSFISGKPSALYIQALKRTQLKTVSRQAYFDFMKGSAENTALWVAIMEELVLQQMERERDLLTASPGERYERVRKRSPQLFQAVPLKYIASYLRMTPETLSRINKS